MKKYIYDDTQKEIEKEKEKEKKREIERNEILNRLDDIESDIQFLKNEVIKIDNKIYEIIKGGY